MWGALAAPLLAAIMSVSAFASDLTVTTVDAASRPQGVFARAQGRGTLVIGVPYLAPEPQAGAKIRSEERLDAQMAQHLGQALGLPVTLVQVDPDQRASSIAQGQVDLLLVDREAGGAAGLATGNTGLQTAAINGTFAVPTGYAAQPKAIIRSDTPLRDWSDVKALTVCMASAATQSQALATAYGATVRTHRFPSDALVAVREGSCDIGLVDDVFWTPLMKFPEWAKFSSTLKAAGPTVERVWVAQDDPASRAWLTQTMNQWRQDRVIANMVTQWARDVAFDVYLDQEVPDCHSG